MTNSTTFTNVVRMSTIMAVAAVCLLGASASSAMAAEPAAGSTDNRIKVLRPQVQIQNPHYQEPVYQEPCYQDPYQPVCHQHTSCCYKIVTRWKWVKKPYKVKVTRYQPCGTPYCVWVTKYKSVKVPYQVRIKVCNR